MLKKTVLLLLLAGLCRAETRELLLPPSPDGAFNSFLISSIQGVLDPAKAGAIAPKEGGDSPGALPWAVISGRTGIMIPMPEPGRYAAAIKLIPPAAGEYLFRFGSFADGTVIFQGKQIAAFGPHPQFWTNTADFKLKLPAEGASLLLSFGTRLGKCGIFFQTADPKVMSALTLKDIPYRAEALAIGALTIEASRRFIKQGQTLRIYIATETAALPAIATDVQAAFTVKSPDGSVLFSSEPKAYRLAPGNPTRLSFAWKPADIPACRVQAAISFTKAEQILGTIAQDFYFPDAITGRISELKNELSTAERTLDRPIALAGLRLEIAGLLNARPARTQGMGKEIIDLMESVPELIKAASAKEDPLKDKTGYIERAYFSPIDNSYQPYRVFVPSGYDGQACPLFVYLHGYVPSYSKTEWVDEPEVITRLMEKHGAIMTVPFGRSNTDFQTVGEGDVMRVIDETRRHYRIDPDRIYMIGYSMGGSGMWTIMQHYPDLFAAGMSLGGRTDFYYWHNLKRADLAGFKSLLIDNNNPVDVPGNFRHMAFRLYHGTQDMLVKQGHSTGMQAALRKRGVSSEFIPVSEGMHWIMTPVFTTGDPVGWALDYRRAAWPQDIDFTTFTPKYGRSWWAEILDFQAAGIPARIQGTLGDKVINLRCTNVKRLRLQLPPDRFKESPVRVIINGKPLEGIPNAQRRIALTLGKPLKADAPRKTGALYGPFKEAFNTPFTVVYGAAFSGTPAEAAARRFANEWEEFAHGRPDVIAEKDLTPEIIKRRSLVLFGDPIKDSYLAGLMDKLPIRIEKEAFIIGPKRIPSAGRGLVFIYPNPDNPQRYIAVFAGLRWGGSLPINHKFDHVPDYMVFSSGINRWDGSNKNVAGGFFDINWKFDEKLFYEGTSEK